MTIVMLLIATLLVMAIFFLGVIVGINVAERVMLERMSRLHDRIMSSIRSGGLTEPYEHEGHSDTSPVAEPVQKNQN